MINTIALLIPLFLLVVFIEGYVSYKSKNNRYNSSNTAINLTIGAIDQICSLFYFVLLYFAMDYVYVHFRMIHIESWWYQWILGYFAIDFLSYWFHRWSHKVNILWAGHITHHSSELFNLSNGFRTSFFQALNRILFWAFLPIFGFSPVVLIVLLKISGIFDFIQHTQYIPRLGFLEKILVTPSLHRVHHGKNDIYIDKNYGSTLIIWDKLFGTYQEETEKVVFGIKGNYVDKNPLSAIGHYYFYLWNQINATPLWKDKIRVLFMSPSSHKIENNAPLEIPFSKTKLDIDLKLNQYASFQIACSVAGIITLLAFANLMQKWEVVFCSVIAIYSMLNSTLIFNNNIKEGFIYRETARLVTGVLLSTILMLLFSKIYFLSIIVFLLISLVIILSTSKDHVLATKKE